MHPWQWHCNQNQTPLENIWSRFSEKWVLRLFRFVTEHKKALKLRNTVLMRVVTKAHDCSFLIIIQTWKVISSNRTLCCVLTWQSFQFQSEFNSFFFCFDISFNSKIVFLVISKLFSIQFLEEVFTPEFNQLDATAVLSGESLLHSSDEFFWLDVGLVEHNEWRNVYWIYVWIIKPEVVNWRQGFKTIYFSIYIVYKLLRKYRLPTTQYINNKMKVPVQNIIFQWLRRINQQIIMLCRISLFQNIHKSIYIKLF